MIGYASRTGTKRNLDALRSHGWRLFVVAGAVLRTEGFRYALDNGAWGCYQRGVPFDAAAFTKAVDLLAHRADFVVLPDIVASGVESLRFSGHWIPRLKPFGRLLLLPVQDGMEPADVAPLLGDEIGLFLGGSTDWKLQTMEQWGSLASDRRCYFHVGRVNTRRRIKQAAMAGANSFDGTSVSRFAKTIYPLNGERRQHVFDFSKDLS